MAPQYSGSLRMPGFDNLRSLWLSLPVLTVVGLYTLSEGVVHFLKFSEEMDLMADVLIILVTLVGGYFGSTSLAKIIRRKEEEAALRKQQALASLERRFHILNETCSDGILLLGADGICHYVSPSTRRLLGYAPERLLGRGGFELVHPDDREMATARFTESLQHPGQLIRAEFRLRHQDGSWRWIDSTIRNLLADPSVQAIVSNQRDITDRREGKEVLSRAHKELEARVRGWTEELASATASFQKTLIEPQRGEEGARTSQEQLRASAARLLSLQEEARARLSREIYDELGQALAALKFGSAWLSSRLPTDQAHLMEATRSMSELADSAMGSVRRIATELRPSVLDHVGLVAALEWQAQEFERRTGIACKFAQGQADRPLATVVRTTVFRICQETLSNVARHANATRVRIDVHEEADSLLLTVADNGRGITEQELASRTSLGLLAMREQALLLGGQVSIVGRAGEGTTVTVQIPLRQAISEEPLEGRP